MVKRREKADPWGCAMDLSAEFPRRNMLKSALIEAKESNLVFFGRSQKERRYIII